MQMKAILSEIEKMGELELSDVIFAVLRNYDCNHPGWEGLFLFLPKDDKDNRKYLLDMWYDTILNGNKEQE